MSEIDQQFIEYVVKSLVGKPDEVRIDRRIDEKGVLLELTVDPEDLGRVIGKRGATAQSLRTLLRALGTKNDARYNLKIIDNGPPHEGRVSRDDNATADDSQPAAAPASNDHDQDDSNSSSDSDSSATPAPADDDVQDVQPDEPADLVTPEEETASSSKAKEDDETSDRLAQARAELADFDDLDV